MSQESHGQANGVVDGGMKVSDVSLVQMVSQGTFGSLYKGKWRGCDVAVKQLRLDLADDPTARKDFKTEVDLLSVLRHPNIVLYMGASDGTPPELRKKLGNKELPLIVFEWLDGGNLFQMIHGPIAPSFEKIIRYANDLACGMNFLHTFNPMIIHRDLKPHNLLIDSAGTLKIGDFGLSRFKSESDDMTGHTGSYRWMAPEVVRNEKYSEKVDVYSFGVILWEMVSADIPFSSMSDVQAAMNVSSGMRPRIPAHIAPLTKSLIEDCWRDNPAERPSFAEVLNRLAEIKEKEVGVRSKGVGNGANSPSSQPGCGCTLV